MPELGHAPVDWQPDDRTSLLDRRKSSSMDKTSAPKGRLAVIFAIFRWLNPLVSKSPWRLFEICDQWWMPALFRRRCQAMLTAEWTHRLPLLQRKSPAEMAAQLIIRTLDEIGDLEDEDFSVIDFCSGGGGPVPVIEQLVNADRARRGLKPIPFLLTDIQPHLDAWIDVAAKSDYLSFIPQPVDATNPPPAVISSSASASSSPEDSASAAKPATRVFRLYCLAFHHFDDARARRTLRSTLRTADGFAIVELQDRHLASLLLMLADWALVYAVTAAWFWGDWLQLLFTYAVPVLPVTLVFDGVVSCLRTRTFEEVLALVDEALEDEGEGEGRGQCVSYGPGRQLKYAERGRWIFKGGREMHTVPLGYMNWVVGRRVR